MIIVQKEVHCFRQKFSFEFGSENACAAFWHVSVNWFYCAAALLAMVTGSLNGLSVDFVLILCLQFVKHGSLKDIQMDDVADFTLTDDAMTHMGLSDDEKLSIYTVIAGVLHLGNISFDESSNDSTGVNIIWSLLSIQSVLIYYNLVYIKYKA